MYSYKNNKKPDPMVSYKTIAQSYLAELLASFVFGYTIFSTTVNLSLSSAKSAVALPIAVGFASIVAIYTFIDHTICHFNPAITFAAIITTKIPALLGIGYILSQLVGFILAICMTVVNFSLGWTDTLELISPHQVPIKSSGLDVDISHTAVFFTEFTLTAILVFVVFENGINSKRDHEKSLFGDEPQIDRSIVVPITIGLTLGFLAFLGSAVTGGAYNPGIVFTTQLLGNSWRFAWEYYVSEFTGAIFGSMLQVWLLFK